MSKYKVVVSDQVFPTVDIERGLLSQIDADLAVASGDVAEVLEFAGDADAILNTCLPCNHRSRSVPTKERRTWKRSSASPRALSAASASS